MQNVEKKAVFKSISIIKYDQLLLIRLILFMAMDMFKYFTTYPTVIQKNTPSIQLNQRRLEC